QARGNLRQVLSDLQLYTGNFSIADVSGLEVIGSLYILNNFYRIVKGLIEATDCYGLAFFLKQLPSKVQIINPGSLEITIPNHFSISIDVLEETSHKGAAC